MENLRQVILCKVVYLSEVGQVNKFHFVCGYILIANVIFFLTNGAKKCSNFWGIKKNL